MNKVVKQSLVELFETVANVCDGPSVANRGMADIQQTYTKIMKKVEVLKFSGPDAAARHEEVFGKS